MPNDLKFMYDRDPHEPEFHQAVEEVYESLLPVLDRLPHFREEKIFERLLEAERTIMFRVAWIDDNNEVQINRGFRVQWNSAIGPYKGGCRFHPSVNLSIMKFLAFEQTFKNSLTTLPMGSAKGGSDFDPKGRSDREVLRFCQTFMTELYRHLGPNTDIPAGDIGVGQREIGYMFGMYRRLVNKFTGSFTGKGLSFGGSYMRPAATGFGNVYFALEMAKANKRSLKNAKCLVSGSGNVAQYTLVKLVEIGALPLTASDSNGYIYDENGLTLEKIEYLQYLKNEKRSRIKEITQRYPEIIYTEFKDGQTNVQWQHKADCVFPSATQNEITKTDAQKFLQNGVWLVSEGSNMSSTIEAIKIFLENKILFGPSKASNAGGVATSGLEMSQNSLRYLWTSDEVDKKLKDIMTNIHNVCWETAQEYGKKGNYVFGANAAAFIKVGDAMYAQGII